MKFIILRKDFKTLILIFATTSAYNFDAKLCKKKHCKCNRHSYLDSHETSLTLTLSETSSILEAQYFLPIELSSQDHWLSSWKFNRRSAGLCASYAECKRPPVTILKVNAFRVLCAILSSVHVWANPHYFYNCVNRSTKGGNVNLKNVFCRKNHKKYTPQDYFNNRYLL